MPGEDYDMLVKVLLNALPPHLFMQTTATDIDFHVPFEHLEGPVPIGAEKICTQQFGDWEKTVKCGLYHGVSIPDPHVDYRPF